VQNTYERFLKSIIIIVETRIAVIFSFFVYSFANSASAITENTVDTPELSRESDVTLCITTEVNEEAVKRVMSHPTLHLPGAQISTLTFT
jgi:hypothetical protein